MRPILTGEALNSAKQLYADGGSVAVIANQFGCNTHAVYNAFRRAGVAMRPAGKVIPGKPDATTLKRLYLDERKSSTEIGAMYGVQSSVICRWLKENGIARRSCSEAKKLDMARWSYEDRLRITAASRKLFEGKERTPEDRHKRAKGVERKAKLSKYEATLLSALHDKGLHPIPQMAVGKFNIDLAFPEQLLAIELHGGCWHNTPKKRFHDEAKRAYLEPLGWRIIVIRARRQDWITPAVAQITHALMQYPLLIAQDYAE